LAWLSTKVPAAVDAEIAAAADQRGVSDGRAGPDRNGCAAVHDDRVVKDSAGGQPEMATIQVERAGQSGELTEPELQGAGAR
jgi:hypothetical protein